jgi:hypothetical protein
MRFPIVLSVIGVWIWSTAAIDPMVVERQISNPNSAQFWSTAIVPRYLTFSQILSSSNDFSSRASMRVTATRSISRASPARTKRPQAKHTGPTTATKIGLGVGVPLGVLAIVGAIAAYIFGKRRGRQRRVDDPTAGAGRLIRDPSSELNIPSPAPLSPAAVELSAMRNQEDISAVMAQNQTRWWRVSSGRLGSTKYANTIPQSPQELPG